MTDLTEFLLARIGDDEAAARAAIGSSAADWQQDRYRVVFGGEWEVAEANVQTAAHIARHDPARVLAQCAAYREIVALHSAYDCTAVGQEGHERCGEREWCYTCGEPVAWPCPTLRALASAYADHPAFDPEWRLT